MVKKSQIAEGYSLVAEPNDIANWVVTGFSYYSKGGEIDYDINSESNEWDGWKIDAINFGLNEVLELPNNELAKQAPSGNDYFIVLGQTSTVVKGHQADDLIDASLIEVIRGKLVLKGNQGNDVLIGPANQGNSGVKLVLEDCMGDKHSRLLT